MIFLHTPTCKHKTLSRDSSSTKLVDMLSPEQRSPKVMWGMWRRLGVAVGEWYVKVTLDLTVRGDGVRCWFAPDEDRFGGIAAYASMYSRQLSSICQGSIAGGGSIERHCRRMVHRSRGFWWTDAWLETILSDRFLFYVGNERKGIANSTEINTD